MRPQTAKRPARGLADRFCASRFGRERGAGLQCDDYWAIVNVRFVSSSVSVFSTAMPVLSAGMLS